MQEEMREHLARAAARYEARGLSPDEARHAAQREFGNETVLQEEARDARGARWVDELAGDLRFALRYFARHKGNTALIVVVLTLATGANTLIFSMVQAQFFRPAPAVPQDASHVRIYSQERSTTTAAWQPRLFNGRELEALTARSEIFRDVAAWVEEEAVLGGRDSTVARAVGAQFVTPNYFAVLGLQLAAGAGFRHDADIAMQPTAVLAYGMAERLYGDAARAVGREIRVNDVPVQVVGVAPRRFQGALRNMDEPVLWLPLSARAAIDRVSPRWLADEHRLSLFARLAPDVSHEQATAAVRLIDTRLLPDGAAAVGMARASEVLSMHAVPPGSDRAEKRLAITAVFIIGLLILLVGWMNVSSLMVAAALGRRHEIAVRLSLGASRVRLLRQLVTESVVLTLGAAAAGMVLAWWLLAWNQRTEIDGVDLTPDLGTFAFVAGLALTTGILFGLSPAFHATRAAVSTALRESGAGATARARLQRGFVVAQIALSQPLLVLLGAMLSLVIANYQPLPSALSEQVIAIDFRPLAAAGAQSPEAVAALTARIAERPETRAAVPRPDGFDVRRVIAPDGRVPDADTETIPSIVNVEGVAPGWFGAVDVPIVLGRDVSLADTAAADWPIVIGSDLARALWGNQHPIGRTLASPPLEGMDQDSTVMTVVGVYDASKPLPGMMWGGYRAVTDLEHRVYTAHGSRWRTDGILVRTRGPARPHLHQLQSFIRADAPALPVTSLLTLAQIDEQARRRSLRGTLLVGAGGALALIIASLGLYGVVSLAVRQRRREIGIRIAVGGAPLTIARMFLASGVRVSLVALAIGLPLSVAALEIGIAQGIVIAPEVNAYLIGAVIALVLIGVSAAATWLPARRAAGMDPTMTLRVE
jgi:predicted permease